MSIGFVQVSGSYTKTKEKEEEILRLEAAIKEEEQVQIKLKKVQESMNTKSFIEEMARKKFGLIYPDEIVIDTSQ